MLCAVRTDRRRSRAGNFNEPIQDHHLSRVPRFDVPISSTGGLGDEVRRKTVVTSGQVLGKVEKIRMIAELLQHPDRFQRLTSFPPQQALDIRTVDEILVDVHLKPREVAEDHMFVFHREILGKDIVGPANDEPVDQRRQARETFVPSLPVFVRPIGIAAFEDRQLVRLAKLVPRPQKIRVGKVQQREVLGQIVLDRRSREDHSPLHVQAIECREGLTFSILQPMSFIAQK